MSSGSVDRTIRFPIRFTQKDQIQTENGTPKPPVVSRIETLTRTRTGVENPLWRDQVRLKKNATTAMSGIFTDLHMTRGSYRVIYKSDPVSGWGFGPVDETYARGNLAGYYHVIENPEALYSDAENSARARVYNEIRRLQVVVSGPTFLGEFRQTLQLLKNPAGALGQAFNTYVRRIEKAVARKRPPGPPPKNRKGPPPPGWGKYARELNQTASRAWLEASFGITPLLADIDGAFEALNSLLDEERVERFSIGGSAGKRRNYSVDFLAPVTGTGNLFMVHRTRFIDEVHTVRYRGAVVARAATTASDRFARFGFTPSEFIPTAWELIPWSFLIDYAVNIGDMLTASVTDTSGLAWLNRTERRLAKATTFLNPRAGWEQVSKSFYPGAAQASLAESNPSEAYSTRTVISRSAGVGLSPPGVKFRLPDGATASGVKQLLNVSALLAACIGVHPQRTAGRSYRL